ncbi:flagellar basal body-associated FliL family protein [Oceanidesulfovibrio indonesiensis]|uniref:flagellar basal body-associated FliL family protein n=1 Tax=Oceanidesulfovibrio indonesiensis TaxID=54767 RepID=UPI001F2EC7E9|nr:flagellar basal body-associated FliL family protein [Oceanidesulfovibrio indonesiensis]
MPDAIESGDATPKKKSPLKWILLVVLLLVLGGGGYFAYTKFFAGPKDDAAQDGAADGQGQQERRSASGDSQVVSLDPFLVNLADPLGRRYLKLSLDVEVASKDVVSALRSNEPKVRDALIMLLSSKTFSELSSMESKILLKNEIVERLNLVLGDSRVQQVYFTEMVIQ